MEKILFTNKSVPPKVVVTTATTIIGGTLSQIINFKTVAGQLLNWIPVEKKHPVHDHRAQKLTTHKTIFLFLFALLQNQPSLVEFAAYFRKAKWVQQIVGFSSISDSALNRQLQRIPLFLLQDIYNDLVKALFQRHHHQKRFPEIGALTVIDSTQLSLTAHGGRWAFIQKGQFKAKLHLSLHVYNEQNVHPGRAVFSTACVADHDSEVLDPLLLPDSECSTHVMDRGYPGYAQYCKWDQAGLRFVVRLKQGNRLRVKCLRPISPEGEIVEDAEVLVPSSDGTSYRMRRVTYTYLARDGHVHTSVVLTNRWDLEAKAIAHMYKLRWKIETFFKTFKHRMNGAHLYTNHEEGVARQVLLSLIAYAFMELVRVTGAPEQTIQRVFRLFRLYADADPCVFREALAGKKTRTSKGRRKKPKLGRPRKHPLVPKAKRIIVVF